MNKRPVSRRNFAKLTAASLAPVLLEIMPTNLRTRRALGQAPTRIQVGQIGTKHGHAMGKLDAIRKLSQQFELVGIVEDDPAQRERLQATAELKDLPWMTRAQLLAHSGLQLALIETEIDQLLATAEQCLSAGMHIHLDKPAGSSLEAFRRVAALAEEKRRLIQMGYMYRGNPAFKFLFDVVKKGWLGEIFEVHGVISKQIGDSDRRALAHYRGGSMFELGCHLIDAVVKLLGKPTRVVPVNRQTHPESDSLNDNCLAVFHYPRATATIRSSVVEVDGTRRRQLIVCGTQGTVEIHPLEPPQLILTLDRPQGEFKPGTQVVSMPQVSGRYDSELLGLAAAIRGEEVLDYPIQHDLTVQECVLQASDM